MGITARQAETIYRLLASDGRMPQIADISYDMRERTYEVTLAGGDRLYIPEIKLRVMDDISDALAYLQSPKAVFTNGPQWPDAFPMPKFNIASRYTCLIVGYDVEDSFLLVRALGLEHAKHVDHYKDMINFRGLPVYITERGTERSDFGAIEGLFISGGHRVIDTME